ncbi:MAG: hypothetical protein HY875_12725 [Chloroflexi bacterium]|nr:hypothetical protein [Chloroflexota bacterium]
MSMRAVAGWVTPLLLALAALQTSCGGDDAPAPTPRPTATPSVIKVLPKDLPAMLPDIPKASEALGFPIEGYQGSFRDLGQEFEGIDMSTRLVGGTYFALFRAGASGAPEDTTAGGYMTVVLFAKPADAHAVFLAVAAGLTSGGGGSSRFEAKDIGDEFHGIVFGDDTEHTMVTAAVFRVQNVVATIVIFRDDGIELSLQVRALARVIVAGIRAEGAKNQ